MEHRDTVKTEIYNASREIYDGNDSAGAGYGLVALAYAVYGGARVIADALRERHGVAER
jgi:hypothetical protein